MGMAYKNGQTGLCMKDSGVSEKFMDKESSHTLTETYTKGTGTEIKQMGMVSIIIRMERDTKVNGERICNMEKGMKYGQMALSLMACMTMAKSME